MKGLKVRLALPLLLLLVSAVYIPGLQGPLLLDDRNSLSPLAAIDTGTLSAWQFVSGHTPGALFRPVANASFVVNWWLWGDNILAFKAVNLLIHLCCGLAIFLLARPLLRIAFKQHSAQVIDAGALFACAMWLLAPLLVSTVLYTVQRMAQLSTLFTLLGLVLYVHGRLRQSSRLVVLALGVMWPLALFSKENGALLPLLAALIEWWWLPVNAASGADSRRHAQRWRSVLVVCIAAVALALLTTVISNPQWLLAGYQGRDFTIDERLLTQARVMLDYLGNLLMLPGSSAMSVFRDDYVASKNIWTPLHTLFCAVFWLCAIAVSVICRQRGPLLRAMGFGVLFYVCSHLVESSVFALELYFEHRNYLPAFGVFFALTACGLSMLTHIRHTIVATLALVLVLGCALFSVQRTVLWGDEARLYKQAVQTHPQSARAWLGLASVQFADDQFDAALASLAQGARIIGPTARVATALQGIAAYCVANRPIPDSLWQQLRDAPMLGADLLTINSLAWMAGAFRADTCNASDRARIQSRLRAIAHAPVSWNRSRQQLRDTHLQQLLSIH